MSTYAAPQIAGEKNEILSSEQTFHALNDTWNFYAHMPHDTDWSITSYKKLLTVKHAEDLIAMMEAIPDKMIQNCMLFIMKEHVKPIWEDEENRHGGSFSFKISNEDVVKIWKDLSFKTLGCSLTEPEVYNDINGITISPKRNFCIVKIWMKSCDVKTIDFLKQNAPKLHQKGAIFKKHNPEY